jgi:hypothetical protein
MPIVQTRYRDIPYEEVERLHAKMGDCSSERWETVLRGRPIAVVTPTLSESEMDREQRSCALPGGGYAIVCGGRRRMSKEEKKLTQEMMVQIEAARKAVAHAKQRAVDCDAVGLWRIARWWDHVATTGEQDLALQLRVLRGDSIPPGFQEDESARKAGHEL